MTFPSSLAFFDHLMNEGALDEHTLLAFLAKPASDEGLHLDFKSGLELDEPKDKRNFTIKQYVSAFANSEGGVLVIGVRNDRTLDPITPSHEGKVGGDLTKWASRCINDDMLRDLGVPPRFSTVDVTGGKVLLIAVARAPSLVHAIKEGKQRYYFRVEDEAREVYPHLISDLLLGRRRQPRLEIGDHRCTALRTEDGLRLTFGLEVCNNSLVRARDVRIGVIARRPAHEEHEGLVSDLRQRIDVDDAPDMDLEATVTWLGPGAPGEDLRALSSVVLRGATIDIPHRVESAHFVFVALADDAEPTFFQAVAEISHVRWRAQVGTSFSFDLEIQRSSGGRPRLAFQRMNLRR